MSDIDWSKVDVPGSISRVFELWNESRAEVDRLRAELAALREEEKFLRSRLLEEAGEDRKRRAELAEARGLMRRYIDWPLKQDEDHYDIVKDCIAFLDRTAPPPGPLAALSFVSYTPRQWCKEHQRPCGVIGHPAPEPAPSAATPSGDKSETDTPRHDNDRDKP